MKVYQVIPQFPTRREDGREEIATTYADTREEARQRARAVVNEAAANPDAPLVGMFEAHVRRVEVSERFGKGRRFVVALLNGEGMVLDNEGNDEPLDVLTRAAKDLRCSGCGCRGVAQSFFARASEAYCSECFDDIHTTPHGEL